MNIQLPQYREFLIVILKVVKRIILASQSPRRKQLLLAMGVEFETIPSEFEEYLDDARDAELVAGELALGKALDVAKRFPDAYVIGSDTIVTIDGHQLAKPESEKEAYDMLKSLAGRPNYVTTGVAVVCIKENVRLAKAATAAVFFKEYDEQKVKAYIATGDPFDKAGGYAIQHPMVKQMIERIEGDRDIIMGLPTKVVASLLSQCGVNTEPVDGESLENL